jgi:agmatine deiminase
LNPNRNPGLNRADLEFILSEMLGVDTVLWLGGELVGDDTDGHIDNLARFVSADTIVAPFEIDPSDPNHAPLRENLEKLRVMRNRDGQLFHVTTLPMPAPFFIDGRRMPANYANFYIGNDVVLVPAFGDPSDEAARGILEPFFPERAVVGIDCRTIIWGLGALHCLSQQIPLAR